MQTSNHAVCHTVVESGLSRLDESDLSKKPHKRDLKEAMKQCKLDVKDEILVKESQRVALLERLRGSQPVKNGKRMAIGGGSRRSEVLQAEKLFAEETKASTMSLIKRMHEACQQDHAAI